MKGMMEYNIFKNWLSETGYSTINDWGFQRIGGWYYYWIINPKTDKFAFIREGSLSGGKRYYKVLVKDWTDHNGWAKTFHEETQGIYR